mmetsp:Transcript_116651/g.232579  ORF Transcript_116651/g.232579 Transcript_116651/m.232579 type:complete len:237 (-) Transcript_116651:536-1246(-)
MAEMVAAKTSMCSVFCSLMTVISSLMFLLVVSNNSWFWFISAVSSSKLSRNFPHSKLMRSCRSPQFGVPSTHFFHCPLGWGSSETGTTAAAKVGNAVVVSVLVVSARDWISPRGPCTCPRASRRARLASGVINRSICDCRLGFLKFKEGPVSDWHTCTLGSPICTKLESLHAVACKMKSNTARSFLRIFMMRAFSKRVSVNSVVTFSSLSSASFLSLSVSTIPWLAPTRLSPKRAS